MKKLTLGCLVAATLLSASPLAAQRTMTVSELFSLVESGSATLRTGKTGVAVAERAIEEAKSQRLPDVNASLSVAYNGNVLMTDRDFSNAKGFSQPHFGNSFALEAQQVVYAGGAINAGIRMAELQKEQSENNVSQMRNGQRMLALGQYLDLFKIENNIKVYDNNITLTEKLIADINSKHQQGMALRNDVTRYELQMEQLRLAKRKLEDQRSILSHQLCHTLGISEQLITASINLDDYMQRNLSEANLQQRAAASSPEMRRSALNMQMADEQLRLAKSELMPKVAVFAADNFSGPFQYDIPPIDNNFNIWYVGVGVKYSLSSLFKSNKSVRKAREQIRQSRDAHLVAGQSVDNNMQQAYTLHNQAFAELDTRRKSTELANQNYRVVNDRYLNQLALITDMIDASNIKLDAELQEVNARINIAYTYYNIMFVAGEI